MSDDIPTTISSFDERWWAGPMARRRLEHQLAGEDGACSWPECAWHGVLPGEENEASPASPP